MKPLSVEVLGITYHRPGLTKVKFAASYGDYIRRGTMVYDIVKGHFLSHKSDITILDSICSALQTCPYQQTV